MISLFNFVKTVVNKKIHVLNLNGVITANESNELLNKNKSVVSLMNRLDELMSTDDCVGILLRINSPGGTAGASEELARTILKVRQHRIPVVASVIDMACSGAYMAAACCDYIFANHMSIVGSIGVIMQIPNYTELANKLGVTLNTIKAGNMKDIGNPTRHMTDEERKYLEELTDKSHKEFIKLVQENRHITNVEEMTDGRIVDASTALENHLIDAYGTYYDALNYLINKTGLDKDSITIEEDKTHVSLLKRLMNAYSDMVLTLNNPVLKL